MRTQDEIRETLFQSTLPARGATRPAAARMTRQNFNPRSLHGERRRFQRRNLPDLLISIHAPCTGSDAALARQRHHRVAFQSTLPARGATTRRRACTDAPLFQSTLPARGATLATVYAGTGQGHFNPRSLHGERPVVGGKKYSDVVISIHAPCTGSDDTTTFYRGTDGDFNPRSLHGERRSAIVFLLRRNLISIHAPCTGSDACIPA